MFNERKVKKIVHQILSALNFLHGKNIVHRDLKSENILLEQNLYSCKEEDIVAKIADFGMACYIDPTSDG